MTIDAAGQITSINRPAARILGIDSESALELSLFTPGKDDAAKLEYGKSITDACLGWDDSLQSLEVLSEAVKARRAR
jgi:3-deoxy-7-phosphoheptulonate synthase